MIKKIHELTELLVSKYGYDLSSVVIIIEDYRSISVLQNAFSFVNEPIILPDIYALNNIPNDDLSYFKIPNLLLTNAAVISFAEYLLKNSNSQSWDQVLDLSRYVISYVCFLAGNNISLNEINQHILFSEHKNNLYRELPVDLLIAWKNSSNYVMPFEKYDYSIDIIRSKLSEVNKDFYFFGLSSINMAKFEKIIVQNQAIGRNSFFVIDYNYEEDLKENIFDYYEFSNVYDQVSYIANLASSYIADEKKVGIVGLDSKLNKILGLELTKRSIDIQQKFSFFDLGEKIDLSDMECSIVDDYLAFSNTYKILDRFWYKVAKDFQGTDFADKKNISKIPEAVASYVLNNNFVNIGNKSDYISFFRGINDLYFSNCDVFIFICQNNFPELVSDELNILNQDQFFSLMEKKFIQYSAQSKVILTYAAGKNIYPSLLSKLQVFGYVNNMIQNCENAVVSYSNVKFCTCKHKNFKISCLPKVISLTAVNNLVNSPYRFFINNFLCLKSVEDKSNISLSQLGDIFHRSIEELISDTSIGRDFWQENLINIVEKNFKLFAYDFFSGSKYQKLYSSFVRLLCKRVVKFLNSKFPSKGKFLLEQDFVYELSNGRSVKFRCDSIIFDNDTVNILEYKLSNRSVNVFKFQIIMELYMVLNLLNSGCLNYLLSIEKDFKAEDVFGTYIKLAMGDKFKTQDFYLISDVSRDNREVEKIIDSFLSILDKDEHIIELLDDDYKHFSRILE